MVALWVWWLAAGLAFLGMLLLAAGAAYGKAWPGRLLDFLGMMTLAWGIAVALVSGVVEFVAWWLT